MKKYSKRPRGVAGSRPCPSSVQAEAFIGDNLEETTATESFGVRLPLDLQNVKG